MGGRGGVKIVTLPPPLFRIKEGQIVSVVDGRPVFTEDDFKASLKAVQEKFAGQGAMPFTITFKPVGWAPAAPAPAPAAPTPPVEAAGAAEPAPPLAPASAEETEEEPVLAAAAVVADSEDEGDGEPALVGVVEAPAAGEEAPGEESWHGGYLSLASVVAEPAADAPAEGGTAPAEEESYFSLAAIGTSFSGVFGMGEALDTDGDGEWKRVCEEERKDDVGGEGGGRPHLATTPNSQACSRARRWLWAPKSLA